VKRSGCKFILASILFIAVSSSATAQTFIFKNIPKDVPQIGLRFLRPNFKSDADLSTLSGIYDVTLSLAVNEKWSIDASFPYTNVSSGGDGDSNGYMGNVYAGMQHISRKGSRSTIVSFGAFMPTGDDALEHMIFGILTNYEDMFKYYPETWTLYGNFAYFDIKKGGARLGLEIGPDLMIPTGDDGDDPEFLMHYGLTAGYQGESIAAMTELIGMVWLTEDFDDSGDRFAHSINFGVSYVSEHFMPGVFYKIYLKDDFRDLVDGVLGVNLEFTM
jgi:hypothetical protein